MKQSIPHIALVILVALAVSASGCKKKPGSNMGFAFLTGAVPKVMSSMPANEATGVSITPTISARFSMDMDPSTMTTGNITVSGGTKGDITGTVVYDKKQRTATFVLVSPASLEYLTDYTVTVNDDAKSKYGKNLANDVQWSFTTVAEGTVPAPELTPLPGTHDNEVAVSITCDDASASIRYTIDGTTMPTRDIGTPYGGPGTLEITGNTLLRAVAYRTGWETSSVTEGQYNIRTASPAFDPTGDQYSTNQQVTITAPGATIYYTLTTGTIASPPEDPAIPTTDSTVFNSLAPIQVQGDNTMVKIKAMAVKAGMAQSLVVSKSYSIAWDTAGAPSFNDPEGTYTGTKYITISSTTDGATIHYTTDGVTEPSRTVGIDSPNPVEVSHNMVIKAIAFKDEYKDSSVVTATYNIRLPKPDFDPDPALSAGDVDVIITSEGDAIYYEVTAATGSTPDDPDDPTTSSGMFSAATPIEVYGHTRYVKIKAMAVKAGMTNSEVQYGEYLVDWSLTPARWGEAIWGIHKWNP